VIGCFGLITPKTLGQPVCRTANALTAAIQNVRVNHGRTNVAVPQKFLNGSNDIAIGKQMGSKRMPRGFSSGRLHSFRHFFCSQMANANTPIMALQQWLGHRNSAMVMHYYHLNSADAKKLMSSIRLLPRSEQIPGNG
jgi:integrase